MELILYYIIVLVRLL